jgi:hypothetical protein
MKYLAADLAGPIAKQSMTTANVGRMAFRCAFGQITGPDLTVSSQGASLAITNDDDRLGSITSGWPLGDDRNGPDADAMQCV